MLSGLAWLVRLRLLPSLSPFARLFHLVTNVLRWGEHRGGMFVLVRGKPRTGDPLAGVQVPQSKTAPPVSPAPSHLEQVLAQTATNLPVGEPGKNGHRHDPPPLGTGAEAMAYSRMRYQQFSKSRKVNPSPGEKP
jgi:hypothetical protein